VCQAPKWCDRQKAPSRAILRAIELRVSIRYFLLCKMEQWLQEKASGGTLFFNIDE
jgi:hypothetical protein